MSDPTPLAAAALAAIIAALLVPAAAWLARVTGIVAPPRADRWGGRPTPLLGGLAIVASLAGVSVALGGGQGSRATPILVGTAAACALGLFDDIRGLRPTSKLVGQVAIGSGLALAGVRPDVLAMVPPAAFLAAVLWIVLLMNAVNLSDNMDGLAAGLAAIAASVLILLAPQGAAWAAVVAAATAGACLGFLIHNFAPARIYMGDAGSLALGCVLGSLTLVMTNQAASNVGIAILAPLLALTLPIFDTALVTIVRRIEGRPVSQGGRDHTSHRLAALGLSDRETVLVLYAVAIVMAGLGLLADALGLAFVPLVALSVLALVLFGTFLAEQEGKAAQAPPGRRAIIGSGHRLMRYGSEILLDLGLAFVALLTAYLIRFETLGPDVWLPLFTASLPIVVPIQLAAFVLLGVYRVLWRYLSITDLVVIARASVLGTAVAAGVVLIAQRELSQSRGVFLLDAVLLGVLVAASRLFIAWLRHYFASQSRTGDRRTLIVGANEAGEVALRLLLRSTNPSHHVVGFIDDDPGKHRRRIGGVAVLGPVTELQHIALRERVDLVIIALAGRERTNSAVREQCAGLSVELREFATF